MLHAGFTTQVQIVKNLICCKTGLIGLENAQHRYSTCFAALLHDKLHFFVARFSVHLDTINEQVTHFLSS